MKIKQLDWSITSASSFHRTGVINLGGNNPEGQSLSAAGTSVVVWGKGQRGVGWEGEVLLLGAVGSAGVAGEQGSWVAVPGTAGRGWEGAGPPPWGCHCLLEWNSHREKAESNAEQRTGHGVLSKSQWSSLDFFPPKKLKRCCFLKVPWLIPLSCFYCIFSFLLFMLFTYGVAAFPNTDQ